MGNFWHFQEGSAKYSNFYFCPFFGFECRHNAHDGFGFGAGLRLSFRRGLHLNPKAPFGRMGSRQDRQYRFRPKTRIFFTSASPHRPFVGEARNVCFAPPVAGGLRPALTAALRGALRGSGRDGRNAVQPNRETVPSRPRRERRSTRRFSGRIDTSLPEARPCRRDDGLGQAAMFAGGAWTEARQPRVSQYWTGPFLFVP